MKQKIYLVRYNNKRMEWDYLWFTHIKYAFRDEQGYVSKIAVNHKSILRIERKLRDLQKHSGDEFYWRFEHGFVKYAGGKDDLEYFVRDTSLTPICTK